MKYRLPSIMLLPLIALPGTAFAQPEPGDIGITFDVQFRTAVASPPRFTTTNLFYAIGHDLAGGFFGYELGVAIDPRIIIFGSGPPDPGAEYMGSTPGNWFVAFGRCVPGGGNVVLVAFRYGVFDPVATDLTLCITPATPSSFDPPAPGYVQCVSDRLIPFGVANHGTDDYPDGCAVVFPTGELPIVAEGSSWGALKAKF